MRRYSVFFVLLYLVLGCRSGDAQISETLTELTESKEFFRLRELFESEKEKIPEKDLLFFGAICDNVFNRPVSSNQKITEFIDRFGVDTVRIPEIFVMEAANFVRMFRYKDAAEAYRKCLDTVRYGHSLDELQIGEFENTCRMYEALANIPGQLKIPHQDILLPSYKNSFGFLLLPVKSGGATADFVFDTGANISTVTQTQANAMKMRILANEIDIGTSTHQRITATLAVADSLWVGGLQFLNVIFLVVPDQVLSFNEAGFSIDGILGFPIMLQMEEFVFQSNDTVFVPENPRPGTLANLYLDDLTPVVLASSEGEQLTLNLDTGADQTELSKRYLRKHPEAAEGIQPISVLRGGAGGVFETEVVVIPKLPLNIGSKNNTLENAHLHRSTLNYLENKDGNLGRDFIGDGTMRVNFKYMYVDFQ